MLKVECESCKAPYQVDERRVPPTGLKMRCPKCGHTFLVTDPSKGAASPGPSGPKGAPAMKATMVGLAPKPGVPAAKPAAAPPPAPPPGLAATAKVAAVQIPSLDLDIALPAVKATPPKAAPAGPQRTPSFATKATAPAMPPATPAAAPGPPPFGGLDDLDLPALAGDVGLPATVNRKPAAKPAPKPAPAASPAPFDLDVDLPAVPAAKGGAGFGDVDLPAPKAAAKPPTKGGTADLPLPKGADLPVAKGPPPAKAPAGGFDLPVAKDPKGGPFDLPAVKAPSGGFDLPSPKAPGGGFDLPVAKGGGDFGIDLPIVSPGTGLPAPKATPGLGSGGFGEIDLPSVQNDLPMHSGGANLPSPVAPGAHLPSPVAAGAHLPSPTGAGAHLPSPTGAGAHLPSPMGAGAHLPSPMGAGAHLPSPMGAEAHLPLPMGAGAHLPSPLDDDRQLPDKGLAFGELDLPLVDTPPEHDRMDAGGGSGFGEVDLPSDADFAPPPLASAPPAASGGMSFGEVDLGGGGSEPAAPLGPPPATSAGNLAFAEASLDGGKDKIVATPGRLAEAPPRKPSKLPKILAASVVILVVGGAALQFTPLGAFGHYWIGDKLHAGENIAFAAQKADAARKQTGLDGFPTSRAACDDLYEAKKRAPRSRPLGTYAAFVEYATQVRFGIDPARAARVNTFLVEVPPETEVPYLVAAQAAQVAQSGDWNKAMGAIDDAIRREVKDGIQQELQLLKGEVALQQRAAPVALAAFTAANGSGATAHGSFGIARAHYMAKAYPKAREAVDATLKEAPNHVGALTMRAQLTWELQRDDMAALKDLDTVLDPAKRANLGPSEVSYALAAKGWIMFARDHAGEARAAFDEAVKVDPRNVLALVGQGEVLYADNRYTEALTRFDDALQKDPTSIAATIGSAKAKISLERLQDAKTQLGNARKTAPKDTSVALWLAKVEDALGNRKVAEELYTSATDLADPQNPEAIVAYSTFAKFLAAQGRTADAAAKLEQARVKLPDSAALQRAFGEVAAEQGQYEEAITHFEAALAKNPADLGTKFQLGRTYLKMNKLDLAARSLDEVAAIDKEYTGLALMRGKLFEASGDIQKAVEQFESARQKDPKDVDLMLHIGAAYVTLGDTDKALELLNQVKESRPNSAELNHFLGRAYLKRGGLEVATALRYLQDAVRKDPNKADYHLYVAWAANETPGQLGLAKTHVEKALELDKLLADAYWQRGVIARKEGQVNDAVKDLKRALELKPTRHEAHAALAEAYEDKNDTAGAMAEWQRAIAGDDKQPYWRFKYGRMLQERGNQAEAAKHLAFAVENGKSIQPRPAWFIQSGFNAGEALRKTGQKEKACDAYKLFMELAPSSAPDRRDAARAMSDLGCPPDKP